MGACRGADVRVLITNLFVKNYSGSENVVELLADGLRRAGHQPTVLAPLVGEQAVKLRRRGIDVVDRAALLRDVPDVIHAQQVSPCLIAMTRFPDVPVVYSCHSSFFEVDAVLPHPQIREVIAVDESCAAKCRQLGVAPQRLSIILNAVDLDRFQRRDPLPKTAGKALLLTKNHGHLAAVRSACAMAGLMLDELGPATNRFVPEIETVLGAYDIVFATARMALEAAATGCAVVVCDDRGFAGMLTSHNLAAWRTMNFGVGILSHPVTPHRLCQAIAQYDADDAGQVTDALRREVDVDRYVEQHLDVYDRAIKRTAPDREAIALATAHWVEELAVTATERKWKSIARELGLFEQRAEPEKTEAFAAAALAEMNTRFDARQQQLLAEVDARQKQLVAEADARQDQLLAEVDARQKQLAAEADARQEQMSAELDTRLAEISANLGAIQGSGWQLTRRLRQALVPKYLRQKLFR